MARLTPETLADVLVNASDALQIQAFDRLCLRSKKIVKRKAADYAFMLKNHYTTEQISAFAQPYSKCDKEGKMTDFRGRKIENTNQLPVFDIWWSTPHGSDKPQKHEWYKRFISKLPVFSELLDNAKKFNAVKAAQTGRDVANAIDLNAMNTMVTYETSKVGADGEPIFITKDIRDMAPGDVAEYVRDIARQLNDGANAYRDAIVLLQQWNEINTRAELKGNVELDWNYADPTQPETSELHGNGMPFILYHMGDIPSGREIDGKKETIRMRTDIKTPITLEKLYDMDIDKAIAAMNAPDSKVTAYRALLDNKYKKPDANATGQGQGTTDDKTKMQSKIPSAGANSMRDLSTQIVYALQDDGWWAAFTNYIMNGVDKDERDPSMWNMVRIRNLLDQRITADMERAFERVEEQNKLKDKQEKQQAAQTQAASQQPSQNELAARARDAEATRVMQGMQFITTADADAANAQKESVRVVPATPTAPEIKPSRRSGRRSS